MKNALTNVSPVRACANTLRTALTGKMKDRHLAQELEWVDWERAALRDAANKWAQTHDGCFAVTIDDIKTIETLAVGHYDYANKIALYVAELVHGIRPKP
jgi:hypothetical protein